MKKIIYIVLTIVLNCTPNLLAAVNLKQTGNVVVLANEKVALSIDLERRRIEVADAATREVVLGDAMMMADGWGGDRSGKLDAWKGWDVSQTQENVADAFGKGRRVVVTLSNPQRPATPSYLFRYTLYENNGAVFMGFGLKNTRDFGIRLMNSAPMIGANLFPGKSLENVLTLNGSAGAEATKVQPGPNRESANSLMLTCLKDGQRRTVVWGGLANQDFGKWAAVRKGALEFSAKDPVGRLVDAGQTYWAADNFYLDVTTTDPFVALEQYGRAMRLANHANPNVYDFPVLCGWGVGALCKLGNVNNSKLLIGQIEAAQKCGLTKYTKVGIQLVPDTYCYDSGNTEQGWWDNAHWAKFGHLVQPNETFAKWGQAMAERDGIPCTYFQTGMPSDDFARAFPGYMLFNDISHLAVSHPHHQPLVSFDYTDPDFQKHMLTVWQGLKQAGVRSIMFDYPESGWRPEGGFDNRHATTASAYREIFRLCREGLGPEACIDERLLGESGRPCLDVTAGIVDIQRTWSDSKDYSKEMVTIDGLRWYKNRTVFNYYPDTKTVHDLTKEVRQSMLTMLFLTSGRINLGTSFNLFTPEIVRDVSRIYPTYREPFAARPLDAFIGAADPQIYDLELAPDWHQVALFNAGDIKRKISFALCGDRVTEGALGLDPTASYYIYDFWNDAYLGKMSGKDVVERELEPLNSAMLSVRKVKDNPQVLSTNRHVLQGWVELKDVNWDSAGKKLSGIAKIIGGEPFRIVVANNGRKNIRVISAGSKARMESHPAGKNFAILVLERKDSKETYWEVKYK